jgi:hypothetical protein
MSLCIIINGVIRTFFNKGLESFEKMIKTSKEKYSKIHIIMVISGEYDRTLILNFILQMNSQDISVETYDFHVNEINEINEIMKEKMINENYLKLKEKYFSQENDARNEINNPDLFINNTPIYQFYQLKIAIEKMIEYEINNNIIFNLCMRTRFDVNYPYNFYPLVHNNDASLEDKIYLNKENKDYFNSFFNNIDDFIFFLKEQKITLPTCRTPYFKYSFGGCYLNNYISLENIKNGSNNILYMYNDFIIFGERSQFIQLKDFICEYGILDSSLNINHFYAQEAQLLIFCFKHNMNPIMYVNDIHLIRS